uniref:Uncharacterized protein n=1 Tax=Populus trichocarpa TaxID=3694 RepID=A0A2K1X3P9_POPTR
MCGKKVWEDFAKILRNARDIVISSDVLFRCAETISAIKDGFLLYQWKDWKV